MGSGVQFMIVAWLGVTNRFRHVVQDFTVGFQAAARRGLLVQGEETFQSIRAGHTMLNLEAGSQWSLG